MSTTKEKKLQELRNTLQNQFNVRQHGDGQSEPDTPEDSSEHSSSTSCHQNNESQQKFSLKNAQIIKQRSISTDSTEKVIIGEMSFKIDLIAIGIFVLAASTRFINLTHPYSIVFDELHYGKYASLYLRKVFFFDPHPPLGKQMVAASAALFNPIYNGTFKFDRIGSTYPDWVPVFGLRFIPALTGSLVPAVCYLLAKELGISQGFAILAGLLMIFDNGMLIQSRYILMEMPLILFGIISIIFAVKYTKETNIYKSWTMAIISGFFGTLSMSVKYVGTFYLAVSALIILAHLWTKIVPRKDLTSTEVIRIITSVYFCFWTTFLITYVSIFYIHLSVLTNAGPHDSVMTSAFQASLKGGLASIIKGQPLEVAHGSQITLRHTLGRPCWLHSHAHNYPVKYADGRGSSHQQQITCYSFKDVNNWWIVKRPLVSNLVVNETRDVIRNGDEVHLVHGITGRLLNSHDVAAPQSPQNQEVSCYIDHNVSMIAEPLWRVDIVSGCGESKDGSCQWHAVKSTVRLVHVSSGQALRMSGKQLPKWGFHQHEVVTDRIVVQDDTVWNAEEHRYTKSEKDREKELLEAEMIPTKPTILSFWQKFLELQWKMLTSVGIAQTDTHAYSSYPSEWLFLTRGIAYWIGTGNNAQIHLLGNPIIWYTASAGLFCLVAIIVLYLLLQRRNLITIDQESWDALILQSSVCLGGYILTYVYHFCVDRTLFLHHYLPSYVFKVMLLICTLNHVHSVNILQTRTLHWVLAPLIITWMIGVLYAFVQFSPTSYGEPALSKTELEALKWRSTWDFIIQTN